MTTRKRPRMMNLSEAVSTIMADSDSESEPENDPEMDFNSDEHDSDYSQVQSTPNIPQNTANIVPSPMPIPTTSSPSPSTPTNFVFHYNWEDSGMYDDYMPDWLPAFDSQPNRGVLVDTSGYKPVDYFKLFFTDELFKLFADNTNLYARQFFEHHEVDALPRMYVKLPLTSTTVIQCQKEASNTLTNCNQ